MSTAAYFSNKCTVKIVWLAIFDVIVHKVGTSKAKNFKLQLVNESKQWMTMNLILKAVFYSQLCFCNLLLPIPKF